MMKYSRRILTLLLVLVMVCSLTVTAFAADETYSITINNSNEGHTYEAYQIFVGDLAKNAENDNEEGTKAVLSNVQWGANANQTGEVSEQVLQAVAASAAEAVKYVDFTTDPFASASTVTDGKYVIEGLEPGYYLVKDQDDSLNGKNDSYTEYIIEVVEDSTVNPKSSVPSSEKKVKDANDTDGTVTDWQDSADYDIGDKISFKLTGTVAANYDAYETYYFAFHDVESAGLSFDAASVKVYVDGTLISSGYNVVTDATDGCTFEVVFEDLKQIEAVKADSVITVEYQSGLNENAVLGSQGNPNVMYLEYSNNPNWEGDGKPDTGKTPEDKVIVFTYKVIVNKVDENKQPLEGAGFTLYKKNGEGEYVAVGGELKGDALTTFEWQGLDDGEYKLEETTTPTGYNTIVPIEFTITAEHDILSDDPTLTKLEGGDMFTGEVSTGALTADVENKAGATLPETGGMGTTSFYVLGGLMAATAAALLVTKKRMASAE